MRYISLFSGVGGLEHPKVHPSTYCEIDPSCHPVLQRRSPKADIAPDVTALHPSKADLVVGGFPCQDLSIAGRMRGISGARSGLFFHMTRVAREAKASHLIAENVTNLLRLGGGSSMRVVLEELHQTWPFISWRTLNARQFGLPQQRKRVIILASKRRATALSLFRDIPDMDDAIIANTKAAGFYTTAGSRSICYSVGYVPTVKVGSALSIPGPPGIHTGDIVRKATAQECMAFQGFSAKDFLGVKASDIHRQMGNAVPVPMGRFAVASIGMSGKADLRPSDSIGPDGFYDGVLWEPQGLVNGTLATNLERFLGPCYEELSERAASGLIRRLKRSGTPCPPELFAALCSLGHVAA